MDQGDSRGPRGLSYEELISTPLGNLALDAYTDPLAPPALVEEARRMIEEGDARVFGAWMMLAADKAGLIGEEHAGP